MFLISSRFTSLSSFLFTSSIFYILFFYFFKKSIFFIFKAIFLTIFLKKINFNCYSETILKKDYHQPAADNGTYHILFDHATMESVGLGNSAYIRAYLTYKDHTYYGGSV